MTRTITAVSAALLLVAASAGAQTTTIFMPAAPQQPGQLGQPANANTPVAPGTSIVRGHVFAADTGLPLRKAQVRINSGELRENRLATTDADGQYEFKEVRAGRYNFSASKGSYVGLSYGQQKTSDPSKPLTIADNQTVEKLDFSLPRGSVIIGRILDEFGEPMPDVQVAAQQYQTFQGQRRLVPSGRQTASNDIGEFRLFGIPPGQYYLTATWHPTNPLNNEDKVAYAPMYFPGTDNVAQAQRLALTAGQELSDIVIGMRPIRAMRVTGTAMNSEGKPMTGAILVMSTGGFGGMMSSGGAIKPDGTFVVNGLAPGEYVLRAQSFGPGGPGESETAIMKIVVGGDDLSDLRLVGSKPSVATGRVVIDPAAAASLPPALQLVLTPTDLTMMSMGMMPSRLGDDGTFELKSGPGKMRVNALNAPGWTIRAVKLNGTDVTDAGLEFKPNEDISGVEVELTNQLTSISGLVTNARGEPIKDYSALAFAQDHDKWKAGRYMSTGRPDQDGRFKISGLPPGDYYIIALEKIDSSQANDTEFLDQIRIKATTFSLREGETRTVDLKLNTP